MNKQMVAIVAVAGLFAACAPASNIPAPSGTAPASQQLPPGHGPVPGAAPASAPAAPAAKPSFSGIAKADQTVAQIYANQSTLLGQVVRVRGKVVKFSARIMGKNWVHLQDGTGASGSNDLTITTADTVKVGDTVLVTGTITQNKDFGSGYSYALILEDAQVVVAGQ